MTGDTRRRIISQVAAGVPLTLWARLTGSNLVLPYYHVINDEQNLLVKHLYAYKTTSQFKADLDFLLKHYSPIGLNDLLRDGDARATSSQKAFLLTFDDGFREMHDIVAPILLAKGVPATFFVNNAFVDNKDLCYLNEASLIIERLAAQSSPALHAKLAAVLRTVGIDRSPVREAILAVRHEQRRVLDEIGSLVGVDSNEYLKNQKPYLTSNQIVRLLRDGFTIGGHSLDHPLYSRLTLQEQLDQTIRSVKGIRDAFQLGYGAFAFPHNDQQVSREFFVKLSASRVVDVSFGTAGLVDETIPNHWQRLSLEKPILGANRILAFQHARKLSKIVMSEPAKRE